MRKEDLEVLAEKLSVFEVSESIYKSYGKSLVQMQNNTKANYEEESYKKHEEIVKANLERESKNKKE